MKFDWIGSWSQIFRFYPSVIVSLFCAILLDCLSRQLLARSRGGQAPSVLTALSRLSFRRVFLVPELVSLGLGFLDAWQLNIPLADDYALRTEGLGLPLLLFILGIPAWTLCFLAVFVLHAAVVFGGNTLHLFVVRYLGGSLGVGNIVTEIVCLGLNKFPFVIAVALTAISYSTCGAVGLLFGLIVCIWKLFQIYEEQLEDFITESGDAESKDEESSESTLNILSTITVLWLCVTLLNTPSLLAWLKYSNNALDKDPSFWTSVVVCLSAGVLWRDNFESKHANRLKFVAVIAWLSSLCILLFGLTSIYRISYFIAVPIAVLALSQLV